MVITFITILAYVGAVVGTFLTGLMMYFNYSYHHGGKDGGASLEKLLDNMRGVERNWKPGKWALLALISWVWLITTWVS